jgi:hypothetical protein
MVLSQFLHGITIQHQSSSEFCYRANLAEMFWHELEEGWRIRSGAVVRKNCMTVEGRNVFQMKIDSIGGDYVIQRLARHAPNEISRFPIIGIPTYNAVCVPSARSIPRVQLGDDHTSFGFEMIPVENKVSDPACIDAAPMGVQLLRLSTDE